MQRGAPGAIAGVLAAYLMLRPCPKVTAFSPWFLLWFVLTSSGDARRNLGARRLGRIQFWQISVRTHDDVAYMAHIGGLAAGAAIFPLIRRRTVGLFECIRAPDEPTASAQIRYDGIACGAA